jgi:hypothetical protein
MLAFLKTAAATAIAALAMIGSFSLAMSDTRIALRRIFYARTGMTFKSTDDAIAACGGRGYVVGKTDHPLHSEKGPTVGLCLDEQGRQELEARIEEALKKGHAPKN